MEKSKPKGTIIIRTGLVKGNWDDIGPKYVQNIYVQNHWTYKLNCKLDSLCEKIWEGHGKEETA